MSGHLFQGRFKAVLIDSNDYLKELIRYIHLNPIRAKMIDDPLLYRWSSHVAYFNKDFGWLAKDVVLKRFGETRFLAKTAFHQFVISGIGLEGNIDFNKGFLEGILGNEEFIEEVKNKDQYIRSLNIGDSDDLQKMISFVTCWYEIDIKKLLESEDRKTSHVRAVIAYLVRKNERLSLRELANTLKRKESGICYSAKRLEIKACSSVQLQMELEKLKDAFSKVEGTD